MCYIKLAIGLMKSDKTINASNIALQEIKPTLPIYIPSKVYYTCEPLPNEWLDIISDAVSM